MAAREKEKVKKLFTRKSFNSRMLALVMVVSMVCGVFGMPAALASSDSNISNEEFPVVYQGETKLVNGGTYAMDSEYSAYYEFTVSRDKLVGVETLSLPAPLVAAYETSFEITGVDEQGSSLSVGTLAIDTDKNITVSFFDSFANSENAGEEEISETVVEDLSGDSDEPVVEDVTDGDVTDDNSVTDTEDDNSVTDTVDDDSVIGTANDNSVTNTANDDSVTDNVDDDSDAGIVDDDSDAGTVDDDSDAGIVDDDSNAGTVYDDSDEGTVDEGSDTGTIDDDSDESTADINTDEQIKISFSVPVVFDTTNLNASANGNYAVKLTSGGQELYITLISSKIMTFLRDTQITFEQVTTNLLITAEIDGNPPTPISTGTVVSADDILKINYIFDMNSDMTNAIKTQIDTDGMDSIFLLTFPSWLNIGGLTASEPIPLTIEDMSSGTFYQYAELIVDNDGDVSIQFTGNFWDDYSNYGGGFEAQFELTCTIDREEFIKEEKQTLGFSQDFNIVIKVEEKQTTDPGLEKTGTYNAELQQFEWTVTYTPGSEEVTLPITITDTFNNNTMNEFVTGSLKVMLDGADITVGAPTVTTDSPSTGETTVTYTISSLVVGGDSYSGSDTVPLKGHSIVLTYNTALSAAAFSTTAPTIVKNTAVLTDSHELNIDFEYTATATTDAKRLIDKFVINEKGEDVLTATISNKDYIEWKLTFSTKNLNVANLKLTDIIASGLELDLSSIVLKATTGSSSSDYKVSDNSLTTYTYSGTSGYAGGDLVITIPTESTASGYADSYTLTYRTKVDESIFNGIYNDTSQKYEFPTARYGNKASLSFTLIGPGSGGPVEIPVELNGIGVNTHIVRKSAGDLPYSAYGGTGSTATYDAATKTHKIKWTVVVNPHNIYIADGAKITDTLPAGLTYVGGSIAVTSITDEDGTAVAVAEKDAIVASITGSLDTTTNANKLSFTVNGLNNYKLTLTFETIIDESYIADNVSKNFTNGISFAGDISSDGGTYYSITDENSAATTVNSRVLTKTAATGAYDYSTNEITWTVTVNQNKIAMTDAYLEDVIPLYQSYVPNSVTIDSAGVPDGTTATDTVFYDAGALRINLGSINSQVVVTFKTLVDIENYKNATGGDAFKTDKTITVKNEITLHNQYPTVTDDGSVMVNNTILDKNGSSKDGVVSYYVNLNPYGLNLENQKLTDVIAAGLQLDFNSVKLYKVTIGADGKFPAVTTLGTADEATGWTWTYDPDTRKFEITLPGSDSYILAYDCLVTNKYMSTVNNTIKFEGTYISETIGSDAVSNLSVKGSGAFTPLTTSLVVYKVDSAHNSILIASAEFALCTEINEEKVVMDRKTTDANGKLTFYYLTPDWHYWVEEINPAANYQANTMKVLTYTGDNSVITDGKIQFNGKSGSDTLTITNDPEEYQVTFYKVKTGSVVKLRGAEFELTEIRTDNETACDSVTATTGADGLVTFTVHSGTYQLEETKQPSGYYLNKNIYTIVVDVNGEYKIMDVATNTLVYDSADTANTDLWMFENKQKPDDDDEDPPYVPDDPDPEDPIVPIGPGPGPDQDPDEEKEEEKDQDSGSEQDPEPEPVTSTGSDSTPPTENTVVPEDDSYIELDENGIPLGTWSKDPVTGEWVFEPMETPLGDMPGTGDSTTNVYGFLAAIVAAIAALIFVKRKKKTSNQ